MKCQARGRGPVIKMGNFCIHETDFKFTNSRKSQSRGEKISVFKVLVNTKGFKVVLTITSTLDFSSGLRTD